MPSVIRKIIEQNAAVHLDMREIHWCNVGLKDVKEITNAPLTRRVSIGDVWILVFTRIPAHQTQSALYPIIVPSADVHLVLSVIHASIAKGPRLNPNPSHVLTGNAEILATVELVPSAKLSTIVLSVDVHRGSKEILKSPVKNLAADHLKIVLLIKRAIRSSASIHVSFKTLVQLTLNAILQIMWPTVAVLQDMKGIHRWSVVLSAASRTSSALWTKPAIKDNVLIPVNTSILVLRTLFVLSRITDRNAAALPDTSAILTNIAAFHHQSHVQNAQRTPTVRQDWHASANAVKILAQ
ncbi:unnamed protein product [Cyprideis torosa]|uniref:Uncharacterized protein n=1 Tax=Cyprideis torosa TaxID=163714 RepID=A0A7R8ZG47_9CRUS|nr:unnamed protein product [Cyprideis torosa]CAG0880780.1 unnamed protein product [Cyprideis torosa]